MMNLNCVVFHKNEIYWPLSFTGKLSSDFGLLSKTKFNLEDLYLNIKQCILIFLKNYTTWSHNLILLCKWKKRTLLSKIPVVSVHESKQVSCCTQLWKRLYVKLSVMRTKKLVPIKFLTKFNELPKGHLISEEIFLVFRRNFYKFHS